MPAVVGDGESEGEGERIEVRSDVDDSLEQEVEPLKKRPNPLLPSAEEIDDHRCAGHYPYRSWCRECVEGRALGEHRTATVGGDKRIPTVAFDYFFLTAGGLQRRNEMSDYAITWKAMRRWMRIARQVKSSR